MQPCRMPNSGMYKANKNLILHHARHQASTAAPFLSVTASWPYSSHQNPLFAPAPWPRVTGGALLTLSNLEMLSARAGQINHQTPRNDRRLLGYKHCGEPLPRKGHEHAKQKCIRLINIGSGATESSAYPVKVKGKCSDDRSVIRLERAQHATRQICGLRLEDPSTSLSLRKSSPPSHDC